jgi:hypothetical protein
LVGAGLPEPLLEHQFWDDDGLIQMVDLAYPDVMAIGLDSLAHHRDRATFIGDRRGAQPPRITRREGAAVHMVGTTPTIPNAWWPRWRSLLAGASAG